MVYCKVNLFNRGMFINGKIHGYGEISILTDEGDGIIYKGTFLNGKLHGDECYEINYNKTSMTIFNGQFDNGLMNGEIEMYEYIEDNIEVIEEGEKLNKSIHIFNEKHNDKKNITTSNITYNKGRKINETKSKRAELDIDITQNNVDTKFILSNFNMKRKK